MPRVEVTKQLQRFAAGDAADVEGSTVGDVLDAYFTLHPDVRPYVVDEHGAIRRHVVVFLNDRQLVDRVHLTQPVGATDRVSILQALSGGAT